MFGSSSRSSWGYASPRFSAASPGLCSIPCEKGYLSSISAGRHRFCSRSFTSGGGSSAWRWCRNGPSRSTSLSSSTRSCSTPPLTTKMVLRHRRGHLCCRCHRHQSERVSLPSFLRSGISDNNRDGPGPLSDRRADAKPANSINSAGCVTSLSNLLHRAALQHGVALTPPFAIAIVAAVSETGDNGDSTYRPR